MVQWVEATIKDDRLCDSVLALVVPGTMPSIQAVAGPWQLSTGLPQSLQWAEQ